MDSPKPFPLQNTMGEKPWEDEIPWVGIETMCFVKIEEDTHLGGNETRDIHQVVDQGHKRHHLLGHTTSYVLKLK